MSEEAHFIKFESAQVEVAIDDDGERWVIFHGDDSAAAISFSLATWGEILGFVEQYRT